MKGPKFILAHSHDGTQKYVVHMRTPIMIAEVIRDKDDINLKMVNSEPSVETLSDERLAGLFRRMVDWYRSTLNPPNHKNSS